MLSKNMVFRSEGSESTSSDVSLDGKKLGQTIPQQKQQPKSNSFESLEEKYALPKEQIFDAQTGTKGPLASASQQVTEELESNQSQENEPNDAENQEPKEETLEQKQQKLKETLTEKIKYKGEIIDVGYDDLVKLAHRGANMEVRTEQAKSLQKMNSQYENLFENLKTSPDSFFQLAEFFGHDIQKMAHEKIIKNIERGLMSDEQREIAELREWKTNEDQRRQEWEAQTKQEREESESAQFGQRLQAEVVDYFGKQSVKPSGPELARTFDIMIHHLEEKGTRLPIANAHEMAKIQINKDRKVWLQGLSDADLAEISPAIRDKIRKSASQNLSNSRNAPATQRSNARSPEANKNRTIEEHFAFLEKKFT